MKTDTDNPAKDAGQVIGYLRGKVGQFATQQVECKVVTGPTAHAQSRSTPK